MARIPDLSEVELVGYPKLPTRDSPALLLVDKPKGVTSFGVVKRIRYLSGIKKVGHSGTLDPMATGLLVLLLGRATRLMDTLLGHNKTYEATLRLGEQTPSFDADTPVSQTTDPSAVSIDDINAAAAHFVGTIEQETPVFSAVKLSGERLYKKAHRGQSVDSLPRRVVTINAIRILSVTGPDVDIEVECGSGTYIRALANDIGRRLGVGAHLTQLRRTRIGHYSVDDAWDMPRLVEALEGSGMRTSV